MPIVYARGLLSGPRLTSMPALRWAGPIADSHQGEADLMAAACKQIGADGPRRLRVVSMAGGYEELVDGVGAKPQPPSWRLALPDETDQYRRNLKKRSKGCFYAVKRSEKSGLVVRRAESAADLRSFYRLYLRTMRKLSALPRPYRKMSLARELLGPEIVRLYLAELDGRPVAALLNHVFNGMVEVMYAASDERFLKLSPNHAVYDRAIRDSIEEGIEQFDFGSAWPHESLASFKSRWGSEPVERFGYEFPISSEDAAPGARSLNRAHAATVGGNSVISRTWGRMPLTLTRIAGELIWRYA
jgi:hypothetical protein